MITLVLTETWLVMYVDGYEWLVPLILSYGEKVEALEPLSLRRRIADVITKTARRYASPPSG